jgi:hypothetical protein
MCVRQRRHDIVLRLMMAAARCRGSRVAEGPDMDRAHQALHGMTPASGMAAPALNSCRTSTITTGSGFDPIFPSAMEQGGNVMTSSACITVLSVSSLALALAAGGATAQLVPPFDSYAAKFSCGTATVDADVVKGRMQRRSTSITHNHKRPSPSSRRSSRLPRRDKVLARSSSSLAKSRRSHAGSGATGGLSVDRESAPGVWPYRRFCRDRGSAAASGDDDTAGFGCCRQVHGARGRLGL